VTAASNSVTGAHGFIVTNPDTQSATNAALFTVLTAPLPPPVLTSASTNEITAGMAVGMAVYGTGFQGGATLAITPANAGVQLLGVSVVDATNITVTVAVETNAATGLHGFIVMNPDTQSATNAILFTIQPAPLPPPTLDTASPSQIAAGTNAAMTVYGSGFQAGATLVVSPSNAAVGLSNLVVLSTTNISFDVAVGTNSVTGAHGFIVTNTDGQSATNEVLFTILSPPVPPPSLGVALPDQVTVGTQIPMTLAGTGFQSNAVVIVTPDNVEIVLSDIAAAGDTNITFTIAVASNSVTGAHGFIVTNPDGQSVTNANLFSVLALPVIVDVQAAGEVGLIVTWTTAPNTTNQLMSAETMEDAWQDVPGALLVTGPADTSLVYTDATALVTTQRFYRVRRTTPP